LLNDNVALLKPFNIFADIGTATFPIIPNCPFLAKEGISFSGLGSNFGLCTGVASRCGPLGFSRLSFSTVPVGAKSSVACFGSDKIGARSNNGVTSGFSIVLGISKVWGRRIPLSLLTKTRFCSKFNLVLAVLGAASFAFCLAYARSAACLAACLASCSAFAGFSLRNASLTLIYSFPSASFAASFAA